MAITLLANSFSALCLCLETGTASPHPYHPHLVSTPYPGAHVNGGLQTAPASASAFAPASLFPSVQGARVCTSPGQTFLLTCLVIPRSGLPGRRHTIVTTSLVRVFVGRWPHRKPPSVPRPSHGRLLFASDCCFPCVGRGHSPVSKMSPSSGSSCSAVRLPYATRACSRAPPYALQWRSGAATICSLLPSVDKASMIVPRRHACWPGIT